MTNTKWLAAPVGDRSSGRVTVASKVMHGVLAGALVIVGLLLAGCNTVSGMGKDIKAAGEAIEKSAR
jgi:predicted small secreted protein